LTVPLWFGKLGHQSFEEVTNMIHRVFVYGTLLSGEGNHRRFMGENATFVGPAFAPGFSLFTHHGAFFPIMASVPACEPVAEVRGEVYEVNDETLASLDRLEGVPHHYQRVEITLTDGSMAWAYTQPLRKATLSGARAIGGDWRAYLIEMEERMRKAEEAQRTAQKALVAKRALTVRDLKALVAAIPAEHDDRPVITSVPDYEGSVDVVGVFAAPYAEVMTATGGVPDPAHADSIFVTGVSPDWEV